MYLDKVGTIANIYVNGFKVGYVENIYRSYYFKLDLNILKTGQNKLRIDVESTVRFTYIKAANYKKRLVEDYFQEHVWINPSWIEHART